jgi:hypothetical protein
MDPFFKSENSRNILKLHGEKIPALRAGITSSKIFHAVRAGFLFCFECILVNIIKILLSQHEKSCWK